MPCRCDWMCPTCNQSTDNENASIGAAVVKLEEDFRDLRKHHQEMEGKQEDLERQTKMSVEAASKWKGKFTAAAEDKKKMRMRISDLEAIINSKKWTDLKDFSEEALIAELKTR